MPFSSFLDRAANKEDDSKEKKEERGRIGMSVFIGTSLTLGVI